MTEWPVQKKKLKCRTEDDSLFELQAIIRHGTSRDDTKFMPTIVEYHFEPIELLAAGTNAGYRYIRIDVGKEDTVHEGLYL